MKQNSLQWLLLTGFVALAAQSVRALQDISWGSGAWLGEYSPLWAFIFFGYVLLCLSIAVFCAALIARHEKIDFILTSWERARNALGWLRLPLAALILFAPIWILQTTGWGLVFRAPALRNMIALFMVALLAALWTKGKQILTWQTFFFGLMLVAATFIIAYSFLEVSAYPFALSWSEGNRLWDYSVLFGRERYLYPADKTIPVLLDFERQSIGGIIFLYKNVNIQTARAWIGFTQIFPYLLFGFLLFRKEAKRPALFFMLVLWALLFLKQGPIHPPLVLAAAAVVLLWRKPLWLALPLIFIVSAYAASSRFTWMFAPAIWIGMLEFSGALWQDKKAAAHSILRAAALGITGVLGAQFGLTLWGMFFEMSDPSSSIPAVQSAVQSVATLTQPLIWSRLLPNVTYKNGILLGLLIATLPLLIFLIYAVAKRIWRPNQWQGAALLFPALAFLAVGLIVSAKIGGGGDLHNMDMFLISLMLICVIAWEHGGREWMQDPALLPNGLKLILILMLYLPASGALHNLRPLSLNGDSQWVATLSDRPADELPTLPNLAVQNRALQKIQDAVAYYQTQGEVLFLDQRQLLTFGYVQNVPFVPEYEKKMLMNEAMSGNAEYFAPFYADLAAQRFALIVTEPIRKPVKDSGFHFGEENNAWVQWVSLPILCYYQEEDWMKETGVQLLTPISNPAPCADLPIQGQ